jgi:hypothetical protein
MLAFSVNRSPSLSLSEHLKNTRHVSRQIVFWKTSPNLLLFLDFMFSYSAFVKIDLSHCGAQERHFNLQTEAVELLVL